MNRRNFLRILAGAAATPTVSYFLPPIGGWKSDVIVNPLRPDMLGDVVAAQRFMMISNPTGPSWVKDRFMSADYGKDSGYAVYWLTREGKVIAFDGNDPPREISTIPYPALDCSTWNVSD